MNLDGKTGVDTNELWPSQICQSLRTQLESMQNQVETCRNTGLTLRSPSRRNWGLHFDDPNVEAEYRTKISLEVYGQMITFEKVANIISVAFFLFERSLDYALYARIQPLTWILSEYIHFIVTLFEIEHSFLRSPNRCEIHEVFGLVKFVDHFL